ncbi:MAG: hypothetical protein B7733_24265 [Myxococcales bacterium FL481]|nr:MAG: hypothetical protein B7733_24265 [Myxococcales bacterium FL481]
MPQRMHPLVGRRQELAALTRGLDDAVSGRGNLWFVCGEPGIGKSRLLEEMAAAASDRDMHVFWARCWSSSRAPALWPWIQVLRGVLRAEDRELVAEFVGQRGGALQRVLPELAGDGGRAAEPAGEAAAEFELFDAVAGLLTEVGERRPVLVLLEDLHVADLTSARLLEFLAGPIRGARVAVAGMYRNLEAEASDAGPVLLPLAREVRPIHLTRLTRGAVSDFLRHASASPVSAPLLDAVFAATRGNPLFMCEAARVIAEAQSASARGVDVETVAGAVRERVAELNGRPADEQSPKRAATSSDELRLERDGEYWLVARGPVRFRLSDTKGVRLLARLIAEPDREFHALDLAAEGRGLDCGGSTTTGPILDDDARDQYRQRVVSLKAELVEAETWNDPARAERARTELEFVTQQLKGAIGLGGRGRQGTSASERARVSVQRRIRDAIRRIEQQDADLGRQLVRAVRTGTYCSYSP